MCDFWSSLLLLSSRRAAGEKECNARTRRTTVVVAVGVVGVVGEAKGEAILGACMDMDMGCSGAGWRVASGSPWERRNSERERAESDRDLLLL